MLKKSIYLPNHRVGHLRILLVTYLQQAMITVLEYLAGDEEGGHISVVM